MISEEMKNKIKNFIEINDDIKTNESNVCKLTDIIEKDTSEYSLKMESFNKKFGNESEKFGVYFIINAGDDDILSKNIKEIEDIYKESKNNPEFQYMIENQYDTEKLEDKLKILSNSDEYLRKILYIGKAGGEKSSDLHHRLELYLKYGVGQAKNHKGGRAIWQIEEEKRKDLYICWVYVNGDKAYKKAGNLETLLLKEYSKKVSEKLSSDDNVAKSYKYPFANWRC